jgi:hypothetical protein
MIPLTICDPELDARVKATPPGMMFWSGTCDVPGATCNGCIFYGYTTAVRNDSGNTVKTIKHPNSCALFHKYTRRHGKPISPDTLACKYFAPKNADDTSRSRC